MSTYYMGMDLGSTSAECVIIGADRSIVASETVETGTVSREGMRRAIDAALERAQLSRSEIAAAVGTGYGRRLIPGGVDLVFTEITCHARGVATLFPGVGLIIDIGGQDSKAIVVDESGMVDNFAMNDRCASGTGRFYEVLGRAIETDIADLGPLALRGRSDLDISSLCATFAATEVISLLASGEAPEDIAASVHRAVSSRTLGLVAQVGKRTPIVLTGGVARNPAAVHFLSEALGEPLQIPDDPQTTGALGAALIASEIGTGGPAGVGRGDRWVDHRLGNQGSAGPGATPAPGCEICGSPEDGRTTVPVTLASGRRVHS
ncbi:MAG: acyl-CoA dehydratase activase [Actinomycetota bacterium]|jgi:predicted CoA-substrate-specific enzyme activase|nr:acyl-CoA dehydratase activase [Actinomycetota bacterium]